MTQVDQLTELASKIISSLKPLKGLDVIWLPISTNAALFKVEDVNGKYRSRRLFGRKRYEGYDYTKLKEILVDMGYKCQIDY